MFQNVYKCLNLYSFWYLSNGKVKTDPISTLGKILFLVWEFTSVELVQYMRLHIFFFITRGSKRGQRLEQIQRVLPLVDYLKEFVKPS